MIVVDASAVLDWMLQTQAGLQVAKRLRGESLHAPHLLDVEVAQVLRKYVLQGTISEERGSLAIQDLGAARIRRYPHERLLPRMWQLRHNLTAYDAAYVALAEALDAPLLTRDRRLQTSPGHSARVELV